MIRYTWIVFGAVACGTAIAIGLGGMSPVGVAPAVTTLAIALVATVVSRSKRPSRGSRLDSAKVAEQQLQRQRFDHDLVARVRELVSERDIVWLRREDFDGAWRDNPVSSLRHLNRVDAVGSAPYAAELREAMARLVAANNRFLDYYEQNTRPDLLIAGSDWREIDLNAADGRGEGHEQSASTVQEHLVERAGAVTRAYDSLLDLHLRRWADHPTKMTTRS